MKVLDELFMAARVFVILMWIGAAVLTAIGYLIT